MNISFTAYLILLLAYAIMAFSFFRLCNKYIKQSEENEALKDAIIELKKTMEEYMRIWEEH